MTDEVVDYSEAQLETNYRQLAAQVGNLLARIASPKLLERVGELPAAVHEEDQALHELLRNMRGGFEARMEKFEIQRALDGVMDVVMEVSNLAISTLTVGEQTFHDASAMDCECFF